MLDHWGGVEGDQGFPVCAATGGCIAEWRAKCFKVVVLYIQQICGHTTGELIAREVQAREVGEIFKLRRYLAGQQVSLKGQESHTSEIAQR